VTKIPKLFPGLPRLPCFSVGELIEGLDSALPAWFVEDVSTLFSSKEIFEIAQGLGQIQRFADVPTLKIHMAPYWRTQLYDYFLYELDEVVMGFTAWSLCSSPMHFHQRDLQYRRDALESVVAASRMIGGFKLEFELLHADKEIVPIFNRWAYELYMGDKFPERRLLMTRKYFPESWWARK